MKEYKEGTRSPFGIGDKRGVIVRKKPGFLLKTDNPEQLISALRQLADAVEAVEDITNEYGIFYRVEGELIGINNRNLSVITIWLNRKIDGKFQFITLKPKKEKSTNV